MIAAATSITTIIISAFPVLKDVNDLFGRMHGEERPSLNDRALGPIDRGLLLANAATMR
jgi:hypothetical protein